MNKSDYWQRHGREWDRLTEGARSASAAAREHADSVRLSAEQAEAERALARRIRDWDLPVAEIPYAAGWTWADVQAWRHSERERAGRYLSDEAVGRMEAATGREWAIALGLSPGPEPAVPDDAPFAPPPYFPEEKMDALAKQIARELDGGRPAPTPAPAAPSEDAALAMPYPTPARAERAMIVTLAREMEAMHGGAGLA